MNPFDRVRELGFKGAPNEAAATPSKQQHRTTSSKKVIKPAKTKPKKLGKKSVRAAKKRKTSITLVKRNGLLIAMTPADVRRQQSTVAKQPAKGGAKGAASKPVERAAKDQAPKPVSKAPGPLNLDVDRLVQDLPRRSMSELQRQWSNVIGKIASAQGKGLLKFRDAIMEEWGRRFQLALDDPDHFEWPSTDARLGDGTLNAGQWYSEGMLSYLGYRVGSTNGASDAARRQILDAVFAGNLPPLNGPDYVRHWGAPSTAPRLKKMAHELATFAVNAKRRRSTDLSSAIADWEADLRYLHRTYYVGRFRFGWPDTMR